MTTLTSLTSTLKSWPLPPWCIDTSTLTPAQIVADQNDYSPPDPAGGKSAIWRLSTDAARQITGIVPPAIKPDGASRIIINAGSQPLVLAHESTSSVAANRIITDINAAVTLRGDDMAALLYDSITARWRMWVRPPKQAFKRLGAQFATASVTAVNVTGMFFNVDANELWNFAFDLNVGKVTTTTGIKFALTFPTGATLKAMAVGTLANGATPTWSTDIMTVSGTLGATFHTVANLTGVVRISGSLLVGTTAGTLQLQLATVTSNNASVEAGSTVNAWGSVAA